MVKKLIPVFLLILTFFGRAAVGRAEELTTGKLSDLDRARQDYVFQYSRYNQAHFDYLQAKNSYHQFGTLASQREAIAKTKEVLIARAEAIRTYLQVVKIVLNNQPTLNSALRDSQLGKIEATQSFIETHKANVLKTQSTTEVNTESERLEREKTPFLSLSHETLSVILISEMQDLELKTRTIFERIKNSENLRDSVEISQAINEIDGRLTAARLNIDRSNQAVMAYQEGGKSTKTSFQAFEEVKKEAEKFKQTIKSTAGLIGELIVLTSYE